MTELIYKTKGNSDPRGKPKVYFSCHPDDFDKFEAVCEDIFKTHDVAVFYKENMTDELTEETRETDLGSMNLFIFPVTFRFLNEKSKALNDLAFAKKEHRPVLPIMFEYNLSQSIISLYSREEFFGKRQFIAKYSTDFTEISYEDKLKKYLESTLIDKETAEKIRKAFDAYIFLSYRKKDRKYANELMSLIHSDPVCRDIAIWFDEFLTPGESFEDSIDRAMKESKLFTLLVTPSLLEENNYVKCVEYPRAVESGLPVLPAEKKKTDRKALAENFKDLPEVVNANDEELFRNAFMEAVKGIARHEKHDDPMHSFLVGLAYLNGIDMEINTDYGVELVTKAAEAELPEAMEKLYDMYEDGNYVKRDYKKARFWAEKLYEFYKREKGEESKEALACLNNLASCYSYLGNYEKALELEKECYDTSCRALGEEHILTIYSLANLSRSYSSFNNHEKSIELAKKCYDKMCYVLSKEHPETLRFLFIFANFYLKSGYCEKAIELLNEYYNTSCNVFGEEHVYTLYSLHELANCYAKLGNFKKAFELTHKCVKEIRKAKNKHKKNKVYKLKIFNLLQKIRKKLK